MFEGKSEKEARAQILELVSEYCDRFHFILRNLRAAKAEI